VIILMPSLLGWVLAPAIIVIGSYCASSRCEFVIVDDGRSDGSRRQDFFPRQTQHYLSFPYLITESLKETTMV